MLRRTLVSRVHLFTALVPKVKVQGPNFLSADEVTTAMAALEERKAILDVPLLAQCMESLGGIKTAREQRDTIAKFAKCVDELRAQLYNKSNTDPRRRLEIHEALMAAGFYERVINVTQLDGEGIRYVLNHYNFDVRRDMQITSKVHETLLEEKTTTAESDQLLRDLLLLERRLTGEFRFSQSGGRRWFTLGMPLSEIKTEKEVRRLMDLEVIKSDGNMTMSEVDSSKLWKTVTIKPNPETDTTFAEAAGIFRDARTVNMVFELRVQKPTPPLDYWERVREVLLHYWVLWFALWVSFFMVDEEIITLVALIFLKHKQTKILEEEAEKSGGKVYVASATGRAHA
jgi:phosphoribosyl-dephospho-CoA transferase